MSIAGCGDDDGPNDSDAGEPMDAGQFDSGPRRPDGARDCTSDEDCVDEVTCTRDVCDPMGYCRNPVDPAVCDDEIFCNGVEQCDPRRGCVPGPRETCNDGDVCTLDRCDEEGKTCEHFPRDLDQDGDTDWFCPGGADCDDMDALRHSEFPEVCGDRVDNDCDDAIDEPDCGRAPNDTCADPLDVSAGGVFVIDASSLGGDYTIPCAGPPPSGTVRRDAILSFTIAEPRGVRIRAEGPAVLTGISVSTECGVAASSVECSYGFPAQVRARRLDPGTYYAVVSSNAPGDVAVTVELLEPEPPAPNETCDTAIDITGGGTFTGSFVDVRDDLTTECGSIGAPDVVYSFTTTAEQDVRISAVSPTGDRLVWDLRSTCASSTSALRCANDAPATGLVHQLPMGTHFIVLEGTSSTEIDYTLELELLPPTPPPDGDVCRNAIPLVLGERTEGTLADKEDDIVTSCGFDFRDVVHSFTLTARRDVTIEVDGGAASFNASVRTACADGATQLRCARGAPVRMRLRDLGIGTYYVVVESFNAAPYAITVTDSDPVTPVEVSGNETCGSAFPIPATGGVFTGDTTSMLDDLQTRTSCGDGARSTDAMFRLDLTASRRIVANTGGSTFDTVLHLHRDTCASAGELVCDDDSGDGSSSLIDRLLDPGTYFLVVDGRGMVSRGSYTLEVLVTP
ncbi:putative metal-binding motif-containing protein [Sandaracinus amylolyticus]|uniref:putative metal-binding motif-containing protein n=1 Tax=Sandaracinus amylolyticus TaxID=927083 RepID=UPI001F42DF02|nr:putative metal-binding motif-containing protein [Sandaracinus amylolyticus]